MHAENPLALPETEQWLLGLIMTHGHLAAQAVARLDERHFTLEGARVVWGAIKRRVAAGKNVSLATIFGDVRKDEKGRAFMDHLRASEAHGWAAHHFEDLCEQLEMAEARRRVFRLGQELMRLSVGDYPDPVSLEIMAQSEVWNATKRTAHEDVVPLHEAAVEVVESWERRAKGEESSFIPTGFPNSLDWKLGGGLAPGDLYVLAGRPHMGKTALALTLALNVARNTGRRVLYFSPEMDASALASRSIQTFGIATDEALNPTDETVDKARQILQYLQQYHIDIVPNRAPTIDDVVSRARAYALEHRDVALIVIDHLGEIRRPSVMNRTEATVVGEIVQQIRALAGDLRIPVLLLSQLSRTLERRDDKRPIMSDLRDSGRIEELADTIMFAYREAVYDDTMPDELAGVAEIIFAKNRRTGRLGEELVEFVPQYVRFQEADPGTLRQYAEHLERKASKSTPRLRSAERATA